MIGPEDFEETKPTITKKEWVDHLNSVRLSKQDLNKLVMNFFLIEGFLFPSNIFLKYTLGYKDAAENFKKESGTDSK